MLGPRFAPNKGTKKQRDLTENSSTKCAAESKTDFYKNRNFKKANFNVKQLYVNFAGRPLESSKKGTNHTLFKEPPKHFYSQRNTEPLTLRISPLFTV